MKKNLPAKTAPTVGGSFPGQFIKEYTVRLIRRFFLRKNFHEVEIPTLLPSLPLEPGLYSLKTHWRHRHQDFYLTTSPESSLKKLISLGIGNCFAISKAFRDLEDIGPTHNLEFSMLEWYEINKNYRHIAQTTQKLILHIHHGLQKKANTKLSNTLKYHHQSIDLFPPWHQFTLRHLFQKYADIDLDQNLKDTPTDDPEWEPFFAQTMIDKIEPHLPQDKPVFIFDYPTRLSPLCQPCPHSLRFSQRFELYLGGMEIGNAYTELTNSATMQKNFKKEETYRQKHRLPSHPYDQKLIDSTATLPPCTGIAVGVDRLAMLFADTIDITNVLYFPTSQLLK